MRQPIYPLDDTRSIITTILQRMSGISKPTKKFILHLFALWNGISGRHSFVNLSRYSHYSEQSIRNGYERGIDFETFNTLLIETHSSTERICVFDPTFIQKSGKKSYGVGKYWHGTSQRTESGIEIGCLSIVDVSSGRSYHLWAEQTPEQQDRQEKSLVEHYAEVITSRADRIKLLSRMCVVDGYFMKKKFIEPLLDKGLTIITKLRSDANLHYLPERVVKAGRGRPRIKGEKVDVENLDTSKWEEFKSDDEIRYYTACVYSIALQKVIRVVYLQHRNTKTHQMLMCTDTTVSAEKIVQYYRLRFQIEFLIRDAKSHAGLEECQARSKVKLSFHFNMALTVVSLAKVVQYKHGDRNDMPFSMINIRRRYQNYIFAKNIFDNLDIDLSSPKNIRLFEQQLNFACYYT